METRHRPGAGYFKAAPVSLRSVPKGSLTPDHRRHWAEPAAANAANPCNLAGEFRKCLRHHPVHVAPERHDQVRHAVEPLPAPRSEFGRLAVARRQRVDLVVVAGEAQREPFLPLAAELGEAMRGRSVIGRKFIFYPIGLAEIFGTDRPSLLPEFAHDGIARILVGVDAALPRLPLHTTQT